MLSRSSLRFALRSTCAALVVLGPLLVAVPRIHAAAPLATPLAWTSSRPLIFPVPDASHAIVSVKDPSVVYANGKWHVFATTANTAGNWSMEYLSFTRWEDAATAQPYYFDRNPALRGYHCAPQVFYFRPQHKWYLLYQSPQPSYSTTDDIEKPDTWTAPQSFISGTPASVVQGWIDFWMICDETHAYLFFSDDHGRYYRSQTTLAAFPHGFSDPVVVMQEPVAGDLFEASCVYRLKGTDQYLCFIECMGPGGHRYFRAFTSDRLDGTWTPLPQANTFATPFAGSANVTAADGGTLWTQDISHGELLRDGNDETMTVDPANLAFLYQGVDRNARSSHYSQIPYRLALLRAKPATPATHSRLGHLSRPASCGSGDRVALGGFAISDDTTRDLLMRPVGLRFADSGLSVPALLLFYELHD